MFHRGAKYIPKRKEHLPPLTTHQLAALAAPSEIKCAGTINHDGGTFVTQQQQHGRATVAAPAFRPFPPSQ